MSTAGFLHLSLALLIYFVPLSFLHSVEIHLHEPLIQKPGSRKKRIGFQVLNALARLEILLTKEEALASAVASVKFLDQVGWLDGCIHYRGRGVCNAQEVF